MLTPFARPVISRIRCLNRSKAFGAITRLTSGPAVKLNPRNFRSCGRATAPLRFIYLELELLCDELRDTLRQPVVPPARCERRYAVVRISNETMTPALQLPVEFVEHEVTEQWRKWTSFGVPSTLGLTNPFSITPAFKNARMSFNIRLSFDPFGDLTHQFVVIDSIEEFLQIKINAPAVTFGDVLLCLCHCLLSRPSRPGTRSCNQKTSGPTASAEPASPPAG